MAGGEGPDTWILRLPTDGRLAGTHPEDMNVPVRKHPVASYYALVFAISWGGILILLGPAGSPLSQEQSPWLPLVYLAMFAGPGIAGIVMTAVVEGRTGFRDLLARLFTWRVGIRWYAVALLTAPVLVTAVLLALSLRSSDFLPAIVNFLAADLEPVTEGRAAVLLSMIGAGLVVAVFEEVGWTGFATPALRQRHGVLATGVALGVAWGVWHFPVFWESDTFAGGWPLVLLLARLFSFLIPYRVLMVWVHDRTGSLLVPILMHGAIFVAPSAQAMSPLVIVTTNLAYAAVLWAIVGVLAVRGQLSERPTTRPMPGAVAGDRSLS